MQQSIGDTLGSASPHLDFRGDGDGVPFADACVSIWRRHDFRMLVLVALIAMIFSKIGTLLPGMAADDYYFAFNGAPPGIVDGFIAQGRGLAGLLALFVGATGASFMSVAWFAFLLSLVTIPVATATAIVLVKRSQANRSQHYVAAALVATHPYLTSYFLFKMSILNTAIVYAFLAGLLVLFVARRSKRWRTWCAVLLALACYVSQIVLVLFVVVTLAWALARWCEVLDADGGWRRAWRGLASAVAVGFGAAVVYLASHALVRHFAGVKAVTQYNPRFVGGLPHVVATDFALAGDVLFRQEQLMPLWLKLWLLAVLAVLIAGCAVRQPRRALACVLVLIGGLLATASPLAFSWGRLVPRTFSPAGLCFGLVICMAGDGIEWRQVRAFALALGVPIIAFCLIGGTLFYQQWLLTEWDQRTADAIYRRSVHVAGHVAPIRIVAAWPIHRQPLSQVEADVGINGSAYYYSWSYRGLFAVATGDNVDVATAAPSLCKGMPSWPAAGATRLLPSGAVLVCIGNLPR